MNRKYFRLVCVVTVMLAASLAALPTAEARGLSGPRATVTSSTDWFSAAMAWMADLMNIGRTGNTTKPAGLTHRSNTSLGPNTTTPSSGTNGAGQTSSCIDPMGGGICIGL